MNGAAKPSGAGGGDCMVVFFNNSKDSLRFETAIEKHPIFQQIQIQISKGVHVVSHSETAIQ